MSRGQLDDCAPSLESRPGTRIRRHNTKSCWQLTMSAQSPSRPFSPAAVQNGARTSTDSEPSTSGLLVNGAAHRDDADQDLDTGPLERLQRQLARERAEKEDLTTQYRNLLAKLTTMRTTLGNKLKQDAVRATSPLLWVMSIVCHSRQPCNNTAGRTRSAGTLRANVDGSERGSECDGGDAQDGVDGVARGERAYGARDGFVAAPGSECERGERAGVEGDAGGAGAVSAGAGRVGKGGDAGAACGGGGAGDRGGVETGGGGGEGGGGEGEGRVGGGERDGC